MAGEDGRIYCDACKEEVDAEKACKIAGGRLILCDDCVVEMWGNVTDALGRKGIHPAVPRVRDIPGIFDRR